MSENQLSTINVNLPVVSSEEEKMFTSLAKASEWLPRFQLASAATDIGKKKKVPVDNYALVYNSNKVVALGEAVEIVVLAWRPAAVDMRSDRPSSYYDRTSKEFMEIEALSKVKNSKCVAGPEFLIWIPKAQAFATFHFNSKTTHQMADEMCDFAWSEGKRIRKFGCARLLRSQVIEGREHTWTAPAISGVATPITVLPAQEVIDEQVTRFKNPPKSVVEKAEPAPETGRER